MLRSKKDIIRQDLLSFLDKIPRTRIVDFQELMDIILFEDHVDRDKAIDEMMELLT